MSNLDIADEILRNGNSDSPAILFGDDVVSYGDLRRHVERLSGSLRSWGCGAGSRIGLLSDNSPFFVIAYLSIIKAGMCAVPLQENVSQANFNDIVSTTEMPLVLASVKYAKKIHEWAIEIGADLFSDREVELEDGGKVFSIDDMDSARKPSRTAHRVAQPAEELAAIMFTSGSTGEPKGVMVSHRNIECNTMDIISYIGINSSDRAMVVLPFYYCYGASLLHTHLLAGGSLVLNNNFMFPGGVLDEIEAKACTGFAGVPSTYQILLRRTSFKERRFPSLRWFQQAGGNLPVPFIREMREAHPDIRLFVMYGQTEATARLSFLAPEDLDEKIGSIGRGLPSTNLAVLRKDGRPVRPGSEEVGEIVASGDNITLGYLNDEEETALYFKNGCLYTGDIGRVDSDGFIYLLDRERDFIKCMGHRVGAKEIEEIIAEIPQVVEVAVIGVPHDLYGEAVKAYIVPLDSKRLTDEDIKKHCLKTLPNYKVPQIVSFVRSIPKNEAGKVEKAKLKEMG